MYKLRGMQTCWLKLWPFSANQSGKSAQHKSRVQPHYSVMPKTTWPSYFKGPASLGSAIVITSIFGKRFYRVGCQITLLSPGKSFQINSFNFFSILD